MNNTLIAIRDNYRQHAIRAGAKLQAKMNSHIDNMQRLVTGEVTDTVAPQQDAIVGLSQARDYYIDVAEKIDAFISDRDPGDENDHPTASFPLDPTIEGRGATDAA